MLAGSVSAAVGTYLPGDEREDWDFDGLRAHYLGTLTTEEDFRFDEETLKHVKREEIEEELEERVLKKYAEKEELFGSEVFREVERAILLRNVDTAWIDHIDMMDDLKNSVGLQSYAQRNPVTEYRIQGADLFDTMVEDIRQGTARAVLSAFPRPQGIQRVQVANPVNEGFAGSGEKKKIVIKKPAGNTVVKDANSVGRNDPCPCGSGKKYKNCCMRSQGQSNE
jgi:preprotein translocase subunit SecA